MAEKPENHPPESEESQAETDPTMQGALERARMAFANVVQTQTELLHPEWERIIALHQKAAAIVKNARGAGIPEEEILKFAYEFIEKMIRAKNYDIIATFMKYQNIGTQEDQRYFGELAAQLEIERAQRREQQRIEEALKPKRKKRKNLIITPDTTIAELVKQLDSEEVDDSVEGIFLGEIVNNFPHELSVKFAEIMNTPAAKSTKVVDFFDESQRDLETDLPIRFQRKAERKKKKES